MRKGFIFMENSRNQLIVNIEKPQALFPSRGGNVTTVRVIGKTQGTGYGRLGKPDFLELHTSPSFRACFQ